MHTKSLNTLEYPKIIERLAQETAFSASRELALALEPTNDFESAQRRQAFTAEARRLLDLRPDAGVRGAAGVLGFLGVFRVNHEPRLNAHVKLAILEA